MNCLYIDLKFSEWMQLIGLLLSILTFIFAIIISKKIGKNHIRTKQIDHVCNLIRDLNETKIEAMFSTYNKGGGYGGSGFGIKFNISPLQVFLPPARHTPPKTCRCSFHLQATCSTLPR